MLDDFRQDRQDQPLDPLPESSSVPWNKKVVLFCVAIACIGLFIVFTSSSWASNERTKEDPLVVELEQIKSRLTELEQKQEKALAIAPTAMPKVDETMASATPSIDNLKSLIEQELQEAPASIQESEPVAEVKRVVSAAKKENKTYTVKKGDSLSKISQKFYGTTKRWKRIVDANKDKLGHNQVLRPGMTLVIPQQEEA